MDFSEFAAVVAAPKEPELKDYERVTLFAYSAEKELLWDAMGYAGIHPIYRALLAQALQRKIVEEYELERARRKRLDEEARLQASGQTPVVEPDVSSPQRRR